ncbi:MAG TPA: MBL fold metallo-hydrolase, partial [Clostridia bacterium]|nr:MBL fold metallo-hydrolase [Clostridia bacterium]
MVIKWLGHSCFLISNDEATTILTDPYDSYVGRKMPKVSADVVITSHSHKDHSAINNVNSYKKVIDNIGEYCYNDIKIITFCRNHDNMGGNLRGKTLITKIITDGLSLCHLGDIGEFCTEDI